LLPALYEQLLARPSLDTTVSEDGRRFALDVLRVATDDQLRYRVTAPLGGLDVSLENSRRVGAGGEPIMKRCS
jgi:hypothetical protein